MSKIEKEYTCPYCGTVMIVEDEYREALICPCCKSDILKEKNDTNPTDKNQS